MMRLPYVLELSLALILMLLVSTPSNARIPDPKTEFPEMCEMLDKKERQYIGIAMDMHDLCLDKTKAGQNSDYCEKRDKFLGKASIYSTIIMSRCKD